MNLDDLLKEMEAKRKNQALPMRRLEDICRDCATAYVHMDRDRLTSLQHELHPFSTVRTINTKAPSTTDPVLDRLTKVLAQRLQIAEEGNHALIQTTLKHLKAYKTASASSQRRLKKHNATAKAAEDEWNQRADTHVHQLFAQEQARTLQVESDFQRLQPSHASSLLQGGATQRLLGNDDATTSMVTRAKNWDMRHVQIDGIHKELRSEVNGVLSDFCARAQTEYMTSTEQLRNTTLSEFQDAIGSIQAGHGAKDMPLQFESITLKTDAEQRNIDASNVFQAFAKRSEESDRQVRRKLYTGLSKMRFFTGK